MALAATRMEYRIQLSHVDRDLRRDERVLAALHPSETLEHLTLRVLAWCLLCEERLAFGPGLSTPEAADLWTHDLTGRLLTWIECGTVDASRVQKVLQHHTDAAMHVVFGDRKRRDTLLAEVGALARSPRGLSRVTVWTVDRPLVLALAESETRRRNWTVTIVGDHLYVDADGVSLDGAVERQSLV